jgi:hypothetical protein
MEDKVLVEFDWYCGRMGSVQGLFITYPSVLKSAYGKHVYFGEILGKHSEIEGTIDEKDFTVVSQDQDFINKLADVIKSTNISGYNPLEYMNEDDQ